MPELFFNRSWLCFDQILNFHRTGNLHFDAEICALVYKTELGNFFNLSILELYQLHKGRVQREILIYPYLGGLLGQERVKIHI